MRDKIHHSDRSSGGLEVIYTCIMYLQPL